MADAPIAGGDLQRLRQLNSLTVLRALRAAGSVTAAMLAERTGLSRASTLDVIQGLVDQGWVRARPPQPGAKGRPARRYDFRADAGHVLGLDVGIYKVLATVSDLAGTIVGRARVDGLRRTTPIAERLSSVDDAVDRCLVDAGLVRADVWTVAVGTTGVVSNDGKMMLVAALPRWAEVDIAAHLHRRFPCPVLVANDSKLAALGEHRRGVAQGAKDVVYLHIGRRAGAALIIDGRLHQGFSGAAGEVHLLDVMRWRTATKHLTDCPIVPKRASAEDVARMVFDAARAGDASARTAVGRYAADIAVGTAAMVLTLDPELVVLGGGFSRSGDVLLGPLRQALEPLCIRLPELRVSVLGDECVVVGASCHALDYLDGELFGADGPADAVPPPRRSTRR